MICFKMSTRAIAIAVVAAASLTVAAGGVAAERGEDPRSPQLKQGDAGEAHEQYIQVQSGYATLVAPTQEVVVGDFTPEQPTSVAIAAASAGFGSYAGVAGVEGGASSAAMDDYKAGPGCMVQCITSGVAYARGVNAELVVHTDTAARIWISVWHEDGYNQLFSTGDDKVMSFSGLFEGLEPDTTYQAMATASDGQGYTSVAMGSFTTLTRNVSVSFTRANLQEAPYGAGTFGWATWYGGTYLDSPGTYGIQAEDGVVLLGVQTLTFEDVQTQYLDFAIMLWQSDPGPDLCGAWALPSGLSEGTASCITWAPAYLAPPFNDLDARPANATSWAEHYLEWNLERPGTGALDYTVPVSLHVWYD